MQMKENNINKTLAMLGGLNIASLYDTRFL